MANPTTNYGFVLPTSSDLVTDLPADFDVALQGVDTRLKALQPGTTLGDIAYSSATANTSTRLAIGSNGQALIVSGGVPAWGSVSGGKVLQAVSATTSTEKSIASTSFTDTNLTITITPTLASSKVLILSSQQVYMSSGTAEFTNSGYRLVRGATPDSILDYSGLYDQATAIYVETLNTPKNVGGTFWVPITYLDSPATTSAITYKTQIKMSSTASSRVTLTQQSNCTSSIIALEIGA
jgi:hypothetical protein